MSARIEEVAQLGYVPGAPLNTHTGQMNTPRQIECCSHGWQLESFVCRHIVRSLQTGVPVGFFWSRESKSPHPDAWCASCEEARAVGSGDWTQDLEEMLDIQLLCGACYEHAKDIWRKGYKEVQ